MRTATLFASLSLLAACAGPQNNAPAAPDGTDEPSYERLVRAAQSYADAGRPDRAAELAAQAAAQEPNRGEAFYVWGHSLAQQQQLEVAAEKYERARALGLKERALFAELASVYDVAKRYEDALGVYRAYLAIAPQDAGMLMEMGLTLLLLDRTAEAVTALEQAAALLPQEAQLQQDLGYALLRAGRPGDAARVLEKLLQQEADSGTKRASSWPGPTRRKARRTRRWRSSTSSWHAT